MNDDECRPVLIFDADPPPHNCVEEIERLFNTWATPGSIATCCAKYFVLDQRSGQWKRLPRWSRRVREAIAHNEERRSRRGEAP